MADKIRIVVLDPGHFHSALVLKTMYPEIDSQVVVYAPDAPEIEEFMKKVQLYNSREQNPTHWNIKLYTAADYLDKMLEEKAGNVVILSGNNKNKINYIEQSIKAGLNVFSDKPMVIDTAGFRRLEGLLSRVGTEGPLLYDIMTERSEITTFLQRELSRMPAIYGEQLTGSIESPGIEKESVHHYMKMVSGMPIRRPGWFFDIRIQGEGIVDVTTHLVDLVFWECFPDQAVEYQKDIKLLSASRWPTAIGMDQFSRVTGLESFPEPFTPHILDDNLQVYANGEIHFQVKGVHARVRVDWKYQAEPGAGDTHYSIMRGSKSSLIIRQGKEENYRPELYIEPTSQIDKEEFKKKMQYHFQEIAKKHPGIQLKEESSRWRIEIPDSLRAGHEAHFAEVTERFLDYLKGGSIPEWEIRNMISKYYVTTFALEMAKANKMDIDK